MKRMPKKITIDELAIMTKTSIEELAATTKTSIEETKISIEKLAATTKAGFEEVRSGFAKMNRRFDDLEHVARTHEGELGLCRQHRALTDTRLSFLESARGTGLQN